MPMGQAPLFGMTSMIPSETAVQTEHGFFTKTMVFLDYSPSSKDALHNLKSYSAKLPFELM